MFKIRIFLTLIPGSSHLPMYRGIWKSRKLLEMETGNGIQT